MLLVSGLACSSSSSVFSLTIETEEGDCYPENSNHGVNSHRKMLLRENSKVTNYNVSNIKI